MSDFEVKKELPAELEHPTGKPHPYDGLAYDFFQVKPGENGKGFLVECPEGCGYTVTKEDGAFSINPTTDVQPKIYAARPEELIEKYGEASTQMRHHEFYRAKDGDQVVRLQRLDAPDGQVSLSFGDVGGGHTVTPFGRTLQNGISTLPSDQVTNLLPDSPKADVTVSGP